jgi:hypothetical protein
MLSAEWHRNDSLGIAGLEEEDLPHGTLWLEPDILRLHERTATITVRRNRRLVGAWILPIVQSDADLHAARNVRLLPYAAPWIARDHPARERRVALELFRTAQSHVASIDLPMAPGFREVTACSGLGIDAIWRHTRVIPAGGRWRAGYAPRVRNHVAAGLRSVTIQLSHSPAEYDFVRGVVHGAEARARFAKQLPVRVRATCLTACRNDGTRAGQAFVVADERTAYLFHSWFDRDSGRGVPSALVDAACELSFKRLRVERFDLEGSMLPGVDEFMSGFGGDVCPYPHLLWNADPARDARAA